MGDLKFGLGLLVLFSLPATGLAEGTLKVEGERFSCGKPRLTETGRAYLCKTDQSEGELLLTQDDPDGSLVISTEGDEKKYYACKIRWVESSFRSGSCVVGRPNGLKSSAANPPVPNFHQVDKYIYRGAAADSVQEVDALIPHKFKKVVIFKNQSHGEVDKEIERLENRLHLTRDEEILWKEFPWRNITDQQAACEMTLEALSFLFEAQTNKEKALFHCTVGEDRTGLLAGLYQLLKKPAQAKTKASLQKLFINEMCEHGYEAGDVAKDHGPVVVPIRQALTPLFLQIATAVQNGDLSSENVDLSVCANLPDPSFDSEDFQCQSSTRFQVIPKR